MRTEPPDELLLRRSEPETRAVLEDWLAERGRNLRWLSDAYADADADADADAVAVADVDVDVDEYFKDI